MSVRRVLVDDDEPHIRAVPGGYLEADGFDVSEAADGEAALRRLRQDAPDLVLLDVMLPGIDGLEVLRQLRTFGDERGVDVHIRSLRARPGDNAANPRLIATVRGIGYKFTGRPS